MGALLDAALGSTKAESDIAPIDPVPSQLTKLGLVLRRPRA
jgi:hypothetical protein